MTLLPLFEASTQIQVHVTAALVSVALGPIVILRHRRDRLHKIGGYVWCMAMLTVAISSFWIREFTLIGRFSPIHLLSVLTLWSLWIGLRHAIARRIEAHRDVFRNLYLYGLLVAGTLNFLPGRRLNQVVFGQAEDLGLWLMAAMGVLAAGLALRRRMRRQFGAGRDSLGHAIPNGVRDSRLPAERGPCEYGHRRKHPFKLPEVISCLPGF